MKAIDNITSDIYRNIQSEEVIRDATHISISSHKDGFWIFGKNKIYIKGRVENANEKTKIDAIAEKYSRGIPIVDELRVSGSVD